MHMEPDKAKKISSSNRDFKNNDHQALPRKSHRDLSDSDPDDPYITDTGSDVDEDEVGAYYKRNYSSVIQKIFKRKRFHNRMKDEKSGSKDHDSDMEENFFNIEQEEQQSAKLARLEDRNEEEEEARRQLQKVERKNKKQRREHL